MCLVLILLKDKCSYLRQTICLLIVIWLMSSGKYVHAYSGKIPGGIISSVVGAPVLTLLIANYHVYILWNYKKMMVPKKSSPWWHWLFLLCIFWSYVLITLLSFYLTETNKILRFSTLNSAKIAWYVNKIFGLLHQTVFVSDSKSETL